MTELIIEFRVPICPVGKARPRVCVRGGRPHAYTPQKTKSFENAVRLFAQTAMRGRPPTDAPVSVSVLAILEPPKSWSKKRRADAVGRPHTQKPDADNIAKAILDAVNGVCFVDDKQVASVSIEKIWGNAPGVSVKVSEFVMTNGGS